MIGMSLFQGLLDREGRVLDKANRLAKSGFAALEVDAHSRATIAFVKALEILGAQEPRARIEDFQEAYATIGSGLLRVGRIESAQTAATHALTGNGGALRALRINSEPKEARGGKGPPSLAGGEAQRAIRCLGRVIQLDPYDPDAWRLRGDVLGASNQNDEALRSYDEALRQRDGDAAAWTSRAELLRKTGRSIDAVSAYDRAIGLTPKTLAPREGRLEAMRSLARWDEVVKEASKIVSLDPRHGGALYAKAHACVQLNRREEALASLDGFLAVEPRSYDGLEAKRDLLLRSERWADLVVACDAILAIQPHHPPALKDNRRAFLALGKAEDAYATFVCLRGVVPDDLDALPRQR